LNDGPGKTTTVRLLNGTLTRTERRSLGLVLGVISVWIILRAAPWFSRERIIAKP
jgi:hypothetical protein